MEHSVGSNKTFNGTTKSQSSILPDYKNIDYRGFVFVIHNTHGMLLLHCTRKPKKGSHYQLPGGHVDDFEFEEAAKQYERTKNENPSSFTAVNKILLEAAKMGAARELFEETGIDIRTQLHRLEPVRLYKDGDETALANALQNKLYFFLNVTDDDFFTGVEEEEAGLTYPQGEHGKNLGLRISHEHSGFIFENDPLQSVEKLANHSGGAGARALRMSMQPVRRQQQSIPSIAANTKDRNYSSGRQNGNTGKNHTSVPILLPSREKRGFRGIFSCCSHDCC